MSTEQKFFIPNPTNGKPIRYGSSTYKKLLASGEIKEYHNPTYPVPLSSSGKVCCQNQKCQLNGQVCCLHGDKRLIIQSGKRTYTMQEIYEDGKGYKEVVDYVWKYYCPNCVNKCRQDQNVPDTRDRRSSVDD